MAAALAHRGPDDEGIEFGAHWGLVSRRLAIIGVANGHQPISNEDGCVHVVFNGEIYNHHALRERLQAKGHTFSSAADTEVLVHLYEEHGPDLAIHLEGMFAFAIYDSRNGERLLLVRDRLGQKPLFYHEGSDGGLVFASELGALLTCPRTPRELNRTALAEYLSLGYVPAPETIFRGVKKLPPAHTVVYERDATHPQAVPRCYWSPSYHPDEAMTFADAAHRTRELIDGAVRKRLESEVPLGAFLSGGVDSTVVVGAMQGMLDKPVKTFCIGFESGTYDERSYAQVVAEDFGTEHRVKVAEPRDVSLLRKLVRHYGEPFADSSMLPTALLAEFTAQHVTVALSGDGGDEVFGGYLRYQVMALQRYVEAVPLGLRRSVCDLMLRALPRALERHSGLYALRRLLRVWRDCGTGGYRTFQEVFSEETRNELVRPPDGSPEEPNGRPPSWDEMLTRGSASDFVEHFLELDLHTYLPSDILYKVDIATMAYSLEVRSPFLDHELVEFAASVPRKFKVTLTDRKRLLKAAASDLLPSLIRGRNKRGFGVPISAWLRHELRSETEALARSSDQAFADGLDVGVIDRLVREHLAGSHDHGYGLWALLCFKLWYEEVLDGV